MIQIPERLRKEEFRFLLLKKGDKSPFELEWQKTNNYKFDDAKLLKWINEGGNYGIIGGFGNVVLIDADSEQVNEIAKTLPETFTIKTGSIEEYKNHYFYICDEGIRPIRLSKEKVGDLGDIRSKGQYVVAPNCVHPSGNIYQIKKDIPIAKITVNKLLAAFNELINKEDVRDDKKEYPPCTTKRDTPYIRKCAALDYFRNNKVKSNTSKNLKLFRYLVDLAYNRSVSQEILVEICKTQGHDVGAIKGWAKLATTGKLEKSSCEKMQNYLNYYHPDIIINICGGCPLNKERNLWIKELKENVITLLALKKQREATELIMEYIMETEHIYTIRDDENTEMWIYKEGIYIPQAKTYIKEICKEILGIAFTSHRCNEVIAKIEVMTYIEQKEFFTEKNIKEIAVNNGLLDLEDKKLTPFSPDKIFFNKLPVNYDETTDCKSIKKHLQDVLENKDDVPILQELFGYLLYRNHSVEKAFMFCGTGRNGKGKTLELMKRFVGPENCCNVPLQQIDKDNFALGEFHNKLANLGGDISPQSLKETGIFKNLTGRDLLSAARKFKIRVHFVNFSKQIFCANELPRTYDTTPAFFNRWVLLNFPYTFISQKELESIKNPENNGYRLADKNQVDKITNDDELSGLLNWALEGLHRLLKQGDFSYSKTIKDVKEKWMRMSDSVAGFLMDRVEDSWGEHIIKGDFRREYALYCKKYKLKMVSDKSMKSTLAISLGVGDDRILIDGKQEHVWQGIKFKIDEEYIK